MNNSRTLALLASLTFIPPIVYSFEVEIETSSTEVEVESSARSTEVEVESRAQSSKVEVEVENTRAPKADKSESWFGSFFDWDWDWDDWEWGLDLDTEAKLRPVVGLHGGEAIAMGLGSSHSFPVGFTEYEYSKTESTQIRGLFGGLLGVEIEFEDSPLSLQTGVSYYQTTPFSSEGTLIQDAGELSPDVYNYHFKIKTYQILWESKLLMDWGARYHPYASVGLGASINDAENYSTNVDPFLAFTPEFEDNQETSFSYSFGLGIDYDITEHFRFGLGYRFTDLGTAKTGEAILDTTAELQHLTQDDIFVQEIMAQLTYVL